jgi:hypothetical protein
MSQTTPGHVLQLGATDQSGSGFASSKPEAMRVLRMQKSSRYSPVPKEWCSTPLPSTPLQMSVVLIVS